MQIEKLNPYWSYNGNEGSITVDFSYIRKNFNINGFEHTNAMLVKYLLELYGCHNEITLYTIKFGGEKDKYVTYKRTILEVDNIAFFKVIKENFIKTPHNIDCIKIGLKV